MGSSIRIEPAAAGCGAVVHGVDLAKMDDETWGTIHRAFLDHGVIFFRDQDLAPDAHISLARRFGPININRFFARVPGHDEIAMVLKEPDQTSAIGERWHTDHSYDVEPAMCSILYALETPPVGGDTCFASMCSSFEALSQGW